MLRSFHHADFPPARLRAERVDSVSVCVPAREEAATIARVVAPLVDLREEGVVDQVLVADADSLDGTAEIARRLGAEVRSQEDLLPQFGTVRGKGDAMWRALSVLDGDVVCFVDADSEDFGAHFACGLLGPLLCEPNVDYVKGFYRRPFKADGVVLPTGGGRVTELTARPLLRAFFSELADVRQPLAGEMAGRRELFERVPFATGYAVEMALLLDVYAEVGIERIAQVDLDVRQNRHQALHELGPMAEAVLAAVRSRAGLGDDAPALLERPPLADLRV